MHNDYLPYYKPYIEADDIEAVNECLRRGWLTTGPKVRDFEDEFKSICGVKHAIAVNSCTAALQLGLVALGVSAGDEVIMPSLSFVAGAECVRSLGGKPVFCDVDPSTLCITRATIEAVVSPRTKVVIPMHYGGQPGGMRELSSFAQSRGIAVLEDAAHGVGTIDGGKWPGSYSDAAAYSFYATKNITSAEGGMLLTNRDDIAERTHVLSLHGMDRDAWKRYMKGGTWRYDIIDVGYKYNLPDMTAALGLSQLRKLDRLQNQRDHLARLYLKSLSAIPGIKPVAGPPQSPDRHSWCIFAIIVDEEAAGISRDNLIDELRLRDIGTSVHFIPTHTFSAYCHEAKGELGTTEAIWPCLLSLPLYPGMADSDVERVVLALNEIVTHARSGLEETTARVAG